MSGGLGDGVVGDFLLRLAIALPLVCAAAVLGLLALRRWRGGPVGLPGLSARPARLSLLSVVALGPAARVALVRLDGRDLLLGVSGATMVLLAEGDVRPASEGEAPAP
ncbi:MAG: flagellar biosynthetic protein FliO [Sphingomonadaceae bacterium]